MNYQKKIDNLLRKQPFSDNGQSMDPVYGYAESIAVLENCIAVVSDLKSGTSRIFSGAFAEVLELTGYSSENSIWEKEIIAMMTDTECDVKYMAELRFYNFLRQLPRNKRSEYYLATVLRFRDRQSRALDVLHRLYYRYDDASDAVRYGLCLYSPAVFNLPARSVVINSVTGKWEELSEVTDNRILSKREKQVLALIERGHTSRAIAEELCISKNTVSRHRQEILAKLQTHNSTEACRRAKQLNLI